MMRAWRDKKRMAHASKRVNELEVQLAQATKVEDLQRDKEKLKKDLDNLLGRYKALQDLMEAEVMRKTFEIDLSTRYTQ